MDSSKLPIHRIDGLDNQLNEINSNIITINNTKLPFIILPANTDFNTLIETGLYYIPTDIGNIDTVHYPVDINSTVWFVTVHMQKSPTTKMAVWQYAHAQNSINSKNDGTKIYARTYNSYNESETGVWTKWFQITGSGLDMPSKKFIDIPKPTWQSGITYTAPANGYLLLNKMANDGNSYIEIFSLSYSNGWYSPQRYNMRCLFPLNKGETAKINTNITNNEWELYRFIYSNSEVPIDER